MEMSDSSIEVTPDYSGPERRMSRRIQTNYSICVRSLSPPGGEIERYAQTRNISSQGVLFLCPDMLEPSTEVNVSIAIPSAYAVSLPAAQLDTTAVVLRSEPVGPAEDDAFGANIALKFTTKPILSTHISMFD